MIEPIHPFKRRELHGFEVAPRATLVRIAERTGSATIPGERVFKDLGVAKRYC